MFSKCEFPTDFQIGWFSAKQLKEIADMFSKCEFPTDFQIGVFSAKQLKKIADSCQHVSVYVSRG